MINSEVNVTAPTTFQKLPVLGAKKVALRDVQNNNSTSSKVTHTAHQESLLPVDVKSLMDSSKMIGMKRPTPDYAASSPDIFTKTGTNEHLNYPRRNLGYPRSLTSRPQVQQNVQYGSVTNQMGSKVSVPRFKESNDELRADRFINLQNFIKQCDGSSHRENIQLLLRLSPSDLSKHAVELEKRAIQLTIEEGKEMQRMQALNILGKPSTTKTPTPITQHKN